MTINGAGAVDHGSLTLNGALTLDAGAFQLAIKQQRKRDNADGRHSDRANGDLQAASIGIGAAVLFLIEHGNCTIAEAATYDGSSIAENDAAGTVSNSDAALKFNTIARPISGALADGGTVEVAGGRLEMADTASAMGVLKIDAGATLQFDGDRAVNVTLAGSTGELGSLGHSQIMLTAAPSWPIRIRATMAQRLSLPTCRAKPPRTRRRKSH